MMDKLEDYNEKQQSQQSSANRESTETEPANNEVQSKEEEMHLPCWFESE